MAGEYKCSGVLFKPSGVFSHAIKPLSDKVFCIRKQLVSDRLNVLQHMKLFETCGRPFLLYCSKLTSTDVLVHENTDIANRYKIYIPKKILITFAKMVLGVKKSAVNSAFFCRTRSSISFCLRSKVKQKSLVTFITK